MMTKLDQNDFKFIKHFERWEFFFKFGQKNGLIMVYVLSYKFNLINLKNNKEHHIFFTV